MTIIELRSGNKLAVSVEPVTDEDFKKLTVKRYFFNWKKLKGQPLLFKLVHPVSGDILGLMHLLDFPQEDRIEVKLLAVSVENKGVGKHFDRIAGNLIAFTCRLAIAKYGYKACISLIPKTELKPQYIRAYGMMDAGLQVYLDGRPLFNLLKKYIQ